MTARLVHVVDDDPRVRETLAPLLDEETRGWLEEATRPL